MRITVTGSRYFFEDADTVFAVLNLYRNFITEINVGDAVGVDAFTATWAAQEGIPYYIYEAKWDDYGKAAGHIRNKEMLNDNSRGCLAIWDGHSRGTANCVQNALNMEGIIWVVVNKVLTRADKHESTNRLHRSRTAPAIRIPKTKRWTGTV